MWIELEGALVRHYPSSDLMDMDISVDLSVSKNRSIIVAIRLFIEWRLENIIITVTLMIFKSEEDDTKYI